MNTCILRWNPMIQHTGDVQSDLLWIFLKYDWDIPLCDEKGKRVGEFEA